MRIHTAFLLVFSLFCGAAARAQAPIGAFTPLLSENFDPHGAGISPGFKGFPATPGGPFFAQILPLQHTQNLVINNRQNVLPPIGTHNLYGDGNDVQILFTLDEGMLTKFGGQFSRTNIAVNATTAVFQFFAHGAPVGNPMTVTLPPTGGPGMAFYVFVGFDLSAVGGYDEVRIIGNGFFPGYIGMDDLIAA